ncbi:uncharacterized protein CYBJADRAFT_20575 [Cyberlindnera jadinii NRRL Y-1542]|uniref:Uncharacterized protein n=1 Tax=Cyberlindnera jadinii (strain ATCC 18201 / CBS 1600 / BCRC 20928 / JCM 3617 / NBRC 0987 / NRRL Y-1542) TaxID=983966 RepID=A0A1E4RYW0_CYBJN|nr:hypothetical protein CYBJADRAFT_20575 [Cyberlindnera jadinii NRRL Y-1542]ODV72391.1 hypothetical protein CYBJADRAFT_20575 [Cyberlindnera jadinii NRRL Y-1542]
MYVTTLLSWLHFSSWKRYNKFRGSNRSEHVRTYRNMSEFIIVMENPSRRLTRATTVQKSFSHLFFPLFFSFPLFTFCLEA